jgi:hypothetical protein
MVILMGALVAGVHAAGGADPVTTTSSPETLTAAQLLDRFEATQRRTYGSFISRFEADDVGYRNYPWVLEPGHRKARRVVEICTDGRRFFWCQEKSGQCFPKLAETTPATDPRVKWFLYDGQYCYTGGHECLWMVNQAVQRYDPAKRPKAYNARLRITISDRFDTGPGFAQTFNLGGGQSDVVPDSLGTGGLVHEAGLAQKLRNAKALVPEPKLEPVNGVPCYVLQASLAQEQTNGPAQKSTTDFVYRLHFDPTHDFHIAKLELTMTLQFPAEELGIQVPHSAKKLSMDKITVDNVRFQRIGKHWVPMAWQQSRSIRRLDDPEIYSWEKSTVRRTRVVLNPDHDALGSFKPTFIQEGWTVELRGFDGRHDQAGPLAWKEGYVVNEAGQRLALR